jgi:serine protease DegQ
MSVRGHRARPFHLMTCLFDAQNLARILAGGHRGGGGAAFVVATLKPQWLPPARAAARRRAGAAWCSRARRRRGLGAPAAGTRWPRRPRGAGGGQRGTKARGATRMPTIRLPLLLRRPGSRQQQVRPGLGRDRLARGLPADQQPRGRRRHEIEVQLSDGREAARPVVGTDPETDLAVLKIDLTALPAITWATTPACRWATWCWPSATPSTWARR